jgi:predicted O-methyltransferase YrrM
LEFWHLWPEVVRELEAKGIKAGPQSFSGGWNDGDAGFVRAIWCLTRHLRPEKVIETGVAHGVTSRFILEALSLNQSGHLWSIDRPPLDDTWHDQIGIAVANRHPRLWSYVRGSSRRQLPRLISQLKQIDLFVHDSLHSERNVSFELAKAWFALRRGGAIVVDDVDAS